MVSFNPFDTSFTICATGNTVLKVLRFLPDTSNCYKSNSMHFSASKHYTTHCWLGENKCAVSSIDGKISIILSGDIVSEINCFENYITEEIQNVVQLISSKFGIVICTSNSVMTYDDVSANGIIKYQKMRHHKIADPSHFALSPDEDSVAFTTKSGTLKHINLITGGSTTIIAPFHKERIVGLDTCAHRSIFVTVSCDDICTLSIWNLADYSLQFSKLFDQRILSVR